MQYFEIVRIRVPYELSQPARWKATLAMLWTRTGARRLLVLKRSQPPGMLPMNGKRPVIRSKPTCPPGDTERMPDAEHQ